MVPADHRRNRGRTPNQGLVTDEEGGPYSWRFRGTEFAGAAQATTSFETPAFGGILRMRSSSVPEDQKKPSYRRLALIFSSAPEPGHSSFSPSRLSGSTMVLTLPCRS